MILDTEIPREPAGMPAGAPGDEFGDVLSPALRLVVERVRLLGHRRAFWLEYLWRHEAGQNGRADPGGESEPPETGRFPTRDTPEQEAAWYATHTATLTAEIGRMETALNSLSDSRFHLLHQIFGLEPLDSDLLQTCLALALDPALSRLYAYLQDQPERGFVTEELVARLFGYGPFLLWSSESPLRTWGLVQEREIVAGAPPIITCDRQVRDWLLGRNELHAQLVGRAMIQPTMPPLPGWPVAETAGFLARTLNHRQTNRVCLHVSGPPGSGRRTLAAGLSAELGLPLLVIDAGRIEDDEWTGIYVIAQRQAYLDRCALAWVGADVARRPWPQLAPAFPLQFVIAEPDQPEHPLPEAIHQRVYMPRLSLAERRELWCRYLPAAAAWPAGALDRLAARYQVTAGEIAAVGQKEVAGAEEASRLVRHGQRERLGNLAHRLDCPFNWSDLVVGEPLLAALEDFVFEAQERAAFWEQPQARRLFPRGQGLVGLFSGPAGTGKTMAAQVIAASLGLDLFRVDLSTVVSKYVGETSQNLERILSRAAYMDIVLLFDEADALFSKRTEVKDAHDRFANTDTNYLLQAIENYDGIALLATNKKANLDQAFIRRLRYVLEFAPPDVGQRLRIWQQITAELAGEEAAAGLDAFLAGLAQEVPLTGAQIKYAILAALFAARRDRTPLQADHLLRGLMRELLKEGRALNDRELEKLRQYGR